MDRCLGGATVPSGDPAALAAGLCELRNRPEGGRRAKLVANATGRVAAFTHALAAERLAAIYRAGNKS